MKGMEVLSLLTVQYLIQAFLHNTANHMQHRKALMAGTLASWHIGIFVGRDCAQYRKGIFASDKPAEYA